jgi:SmpA / OmlA family
MKTQVSKLLPVLAALALSACASLSEQPLSASTIAKIEPGLTQAAVQGLAGRPATMTHDARSGGAEWIYSYRDSWGYPSEFDVAFDGSGRVTDVHVQRDNE